MKRHTATVLLVLAALSAASAFHDLVPKGKELIYTYTGRISAGTNIPNRYASELFVNGKLYVQTQGRAVVAQLSDITYKLYNGKTYNGHKYDLHDLQLPDEAKDLLRPFKIAYESNGQIKSLTVEKDEKMFARNMHRAIAAVLQMDCKTVNFGSNHSLAFTTVEKNLYGKSVTEYNVLTKKDTVIVEKMHEMKNTNPIYSQSSTNLDFNYCETHFEEPLFHDSQQKYSIKKRDDCYVAEHIETTGSFRMYPFNAQSEDHYVSSQITLDLAEITPITNTRSRKSEKTEYDIYYRMYDPADQNKIDLTNGRRTVDMDKHIPLIEDILCQMAQYLHDPLNEKDESINHALQLLEHCDLTALQKIYDSLLVKSPKACEIFYQILPYVGTHASVVFIKKLVCENNVKNFEAIQMLADYPGHVRNPTEALLKELEELVHLDDVIDVQVRRSALLSFASLMYETYKHQNTPEGPHDHSVDTSNEYNQVLNNINGHKQYNSFSDRIKSFFKKNDIFHTYTTKFTKMIHESNDIATQILGMQALFNTKSPAILEAFVPIAKGEKYTNIMMRVWAIWMVGHVAYGNSDYIYELYWPIMTNPHEATEVRTLAYYVLVKAQPSITRLRNIQHTLEKEKYSNLYYIHYNYMSVMSRTTDPCHQIFRLNTAKILKDAPEPTNREYTHYYQSDYVDQKYNYGEEINYFYSGVHNAGMFKREYNIQSANKRYNPHTIYARIEGLDYDTMQELRVVLNSTDGLFNYQHIVNLFNSMCHNKNVVLYFDRSSNKRITHSIVFKGSDLSNMDRVWEILRTMGFTFADNRIEIQMPERSIVPFPTEVGLPVIVESLSPSINRYSVNMKKDTTENYAMHFDNHYYFSNRVGYGLSFYNALADVWQGVGKYHSIEYQFPFYADLTINSQQGNLKLCLKKYEKEYKDAIAFKLLISRQTFIKGDKNGCLQKSCPKCEIGIATIKDVNVHDKTTKTKIDLDSYIVDYEHDSDNYWSKYIVDELKKIFSDNSKMNNFDSVWDYFKLNFFHSFNTLFTQPPAVSTKLSLVFNPSPKYKSSQTDINARFKEIVTQEEAQFLPGLKYNFRVTATYKNKNEVLKTWDMQFTTDLNCGHTYQHTKFDIVRTIPSKKDYKFCYEDDRRWTLKDLTGNSTISIEDPEQATSDVFDITYVGKQLPEQTYPEHGYGVCMSYVDTKEVDFSYMKCLAAHTSLRHYIYKVKAKHSLNSFHKYVDSLVNFYNCHYQTHHVTDSKLAEKDMNVVMVYPTKGCGVDITYESKYRVHEFKDIQNYIVGASNTHTSKLYTFLQQKNLMHKCHADLHVVTHGIEGEEPYQCELGEYWALYIGDAENDCHHGVFLKRLPGTNLMAFKTVHGEHSFEIHPCGDHYEKFKFVIDGTEFINKNDFYSCDWLTYLYRESTNEVIISTQHFYLSMRFTGHSITIESPKVDGFKFYGKCFDS